MTFLHIPSARSSDPKARITESWKHPHFTPDRQTRMVHRNHVGQLPGAIRRFLQGILCHLQASFWHQTLEEPSQPSGGRASQTRQGRNGAWHFGSSQKDRRPHRKTGSGHIYGGATGHNAQASISTNEGRRQATQHGRHRSYALLGDPGWLTAHAPT